MPVFRSGQGLAPKWCEMEYFEIVILSAGASHTFEFIGPKERLVVGQGRCRLGFGGQTVTAEEGANFECQTAEEPCQVQKALSEMTLVRMCGHWGDKTGGCGLFAVVEDDERMDQGDPVDYPKTTGFDNHYHDCDEYWIVLEGRGIAVSEGKSYQVGPGDCIATGMGHHHDFPQVFEPIKAVFFETTTEGQKRGGHLWEHTHGPAQPQQDRI